MNRAVLSVLAATLAASCGAQHREAETRPAMATTRPATDARRTEFKAYTEKRDDWRGSSIDMVPVRGGPFQMSPAVAGDAPQEGMIRDFYISKTEVTWGVFEQFAFHMDMTDAESAVERRLDKSQRSRPSNPLDPTAGFGMGDHPAISMTLYNAQKFCA